MYMDIFRHAAAEGGSALAFGVGSDHHYESRARASMHWDVRGLFVYGCNFFKAWISQDAALLPFSPLGSIQGSDLEKGHCVAARVGAIDFRAITVLT